MLILLAVAVPGHVPTYGIGMSNCKTFPHAHTISQVAYFKGTGGIEVHIESDTSPFDIQNSEILDVDFVAKREYDPTTYDLYVGCGGCLPVVDSIVIDPVHITGYEEAVVEPFTQTQYRSIWKKAERKFNSSLLADCAEKHFTIRLVDYHNRTGDHQILYWGAVLGIGESFTIVELLSFPNYILANHGSIWNDQSWTIWFVGLFLAPVSIWATRQVMRWAGVVNILELNFSFEDFEGQTIVNARGYLREICYEVAIYGFTVAILEQIIHLLFIAQPGAKLDYAFFLGLFAILLSNLLPMAQVLEAWRALKFDPKSCSASSFWAPIEMITGFAYLTLIGSGFFIAPVAIIFAGAIHTYDRFFVCDMGSYGPPHSLPPRSVPPSEQHRHEVKKMTPRLYF